MAPGTLVLVVGPSGAGKDALIDGARARFKADRRFVFPRRFITRQGHPPGERHRPIRPDRFAAVKAQGGFALSWRAHGFDYAIPAAIETELAKGKTVVINVSRTVIAKARRRFAPLRVIWISAPDALLAERLAKRGRETPAQQKRRLSRAGLRAPTGADVTEIVNDGALADAVRAFVKVLLTSRTGPARRTARRASRAP